MARCPSCDYPLPSDRERLGARCTNCREPIYEPPGRFTRPARPGEASCALHPGMEAVATCARCTCHMCESCRTPWEKQLWCASCVEKALEARKGSSEINRIQLRQSLLALALGGGAWVVTLTFFVVVWQTTQARGDIPLTWGLLLAVVLFGNMIPALFGLGQAVTALRTQGTHTILATVGLLTSGLYVGSVLGFLVLCFWEL